MMHSNPFRHDTSNVAWALYPRESPRLRRVMVIVMNLYSAFSIDIFKYALQASEL